MRKTIKKRINRDKMFEMTIAKMGAIRGAERSLPINGQDTRSQIY